MPPQGPDLVLTADVPHGEANVLVLDRLDVEAFNVKSVLHGSFNPFDETPALTDGGNRRDDLSELQLVQNGGLSSGIESHCKFQFISLWSGLAQCKSDTCMVHDFVLQ